MPAPTNGLVLFWNMETLNGSLMKDLAGNANDGIITGAADSSGKVSRARL